MLDSDTIRLYLPVGAIMVNNRTKTAIVLRENKLPQNKRPMIGNKRAISCLSQSSLHKLAFTVTNTSTKFQSLLTLTFLCPPSAKQAKYYLNILVVWLKRQVETTVRYLWFLEFQKTGKLHFHLLLNIPYNQFWHTSLAEYWSKLIEPLNVQYSTLVGKRRQLKTQDSVKKLHLGKGVWENLRSPEGAKRYALKYALKTRQKRPPDWLKLTGRFWGTDRETGKINWKEFDATAITEDQLRQYLALDNHPTKDFDVLPKYLFNFS